MKENELESSDSDDPDFVVPNEPEELSEESGQSECESEASETENTLNNSDKKKKKKNVKNRKTKRNKSKAKNKKSLNNSSHSEEESNADDDAGASSLDPEKEKERTDLLWKSFVSNAATSSKEQSNTVKITSTNDDKTTQDSNIKNNSKIDNINDKVHTISSDSSISNDNKNPNTKLESQNIKQGNSLKKRGLSNILNNISKKPKMNLLEKSKLDWNQFKQQNNLTEELTNFNRGKDGYLERQDFLQRTDSRQFEIEKNLRFMKRKM